MKSENYYHGSTNTKDGTNLKNFIINTMLEAAQKIWDSAPEDLEMTCKKEVYDIARLSSAGQFRDGLIKKYLWPAILEKHGLAEDNKEHLLMIARLKDLFERTYIEGKDKPLHIIYNGASVFEISETAPQDK